MFTTPPGASIVVGTPGRLVDHLYNTPDFVFHNFTSLVIDEADRLFDLGFEREMKKLLDKLRGQDTLCCVVVSFVLCCSLFYYNMLLLMYFVM